MQSHRRVLVFGCIENNTFFLFWKPWKQSETPVQKRKKVLFLVQPKKQELSVVDVDVDSCGNYASLVNY